MKYNTKHGHLWFIYSKLIGYGEDKDCESMVEFHKLIIEIQYEYLMRTGGLK